VNDAVCFRCDWQGRRLGRTCPDCGAALFRASDPVVPHASGDDPELARPEPREHGRARPTGPASRMAPAVVAALAIVAVATFELVVPDERDAASSASSSEPPDRGRLVFVAETGERDVMWLMDLRSGASFRGPPVPPGIVELVDVAGALGVERRGSDGRTGVSMLRGLEPEAALERVGRGDLVAWAPDGDSVVFVRNRSGHDGCSRVRIRLVSLPTRRVGWALDDPSFCGPVVSISRSAAATYFTAPSGDRVGVYLTGTVGVPHLIFDEMTMVSAYPPAAFLLDDPDAEVTGATLLGWRGVGGPMSVGRGDEPLVINRVLAWSLDGSEVALVGSIGATSGVFRLDAGSGTGVREPELVVRSPDVLDATFGVDGSLFLTRPEEILLAREGSITRLPIPSGARSVGPILWMP
jgi:hypothetical protein